MSKVRFVKKPSCLHYDERPDKLNALPASGDYTIRLKDAEADGT